MKEKMEIFKQDIQKTLEESFLDYSAYVLQRRALPDARDGFKYSLRQILHAQQREKLTYNKPMKKAQKSVAAAMSFSYVHGDSSAFGQLMRAGRPLVQRYFLQEIQGNGGTPTGSKTYSAERYVECRGSKLTSQLFAGLNKETIPKKDWSPTYDEEGEFPLVLPTRGFYNLVNGSYGSIGVGLISSIPQFNLEEMNNEIIALIQNPFYEPTLLPDFASGGILLNPKTARASIERGEGKSAILRGVISRDPKEKYIDVVSLPYGVYTDTICGEVAQDLEKSPIKDFKDLTTDKVCIRFYGADLDKIEEWLYKNTSVQKHFIIKFHMLADGKMPKLFTLKEALMAHIAHTRAVLLRELEYDMKALQREKEIIEGLIKAFSILDKVIFTIRESSDRQDAISKLVNQYQFTFLQAEAIVDLRLYRLSSLDIIKTQEDLDKILQEINDLQILLNSKEKRDKLLIEEYRITAIEFGDNRKTEVYIGNEFESKDSQEVGMESCSITFDEKINIMPTSADEYEYNSGDSAVFLTNLGRGFKRGVSELIYGEHEPNKMLSLKPKERVIAVFPLSVAEKAVSTHFELIDGSEVSLHPSFIALGPSKRGRKITNFKDEISSFWLQEEEV